MLAKRLGVKLTEADLTAPRELTEAEVGIVAGGAKQDVIKMGGRVIEALPNDWFRIELNNGQVVLCNISGKLRNRNSIQPGDAVNVEVSPYDKGKGRLI